METPIYQFVQLTKRDGTVTKEIAVTKHEQYALLYKFEKIVSDKNPECIRGENFTSCTKYNGTATYYLHLG